jgi:hypothetical protein
MSVRLAVLLTPRHGAKRHLWRTTAVASQQWTHTSAPGIAVSCLAYATCTGGRLPTSDTTSSEPPSRLRRSADRGSGGGLASQRTRTSRRWRWRCPAAAPPRAAVAVRDMCLPWVPHLPPTARAMSFTASSSAAVDVGPRAEDQDGHRDAHAQGTAGVHDGADQGARQAGCHEGGGG